MNGVGPLEVVPLGGLGEFGMNMMAINWADTALVIDAGVMFPEPELLGIDRIIPDLTYLQQPGRAVSLILTHGHEDHIGAVPHVLPHVTESIYGTPLTLALVELKLQEHGLLTSDVRARLVPVRPRESVSIGPCRAEFIRVTHSMPDCVAVAVHTPIGTVVHTGDFKIDQTPLDGEHFDFHRLAELGARGVIALFADSTNIERRGVTGSERDVIEAFEEIFTSCTGKIVVAAFSSSIYRMQILVDLAVQFRRKVAFVGRGMVEHAEIAERLNYLRVPAGARVRESDVRNLPPQEVLCLCTGSQGEPLAALSRMAIDDHRHVKLAPGDAVVFSARAIPGNEKAIARVMNHIARRGADVIYEGLKHVHVSGHGSEEELKLMLSLIRPRCFVPIHGEYRQLSRHARVAGQVTGAASAVLMAENGDLLQFDAAGGRLAGKVPAGRLLIDGARVGEGGPVDEEVMRDRRHLSEDGVVVPVVTINSQLGRIEGMPEIITRGFLVDSSTEELLREGAAMLTAVVESASVEERSDYGLIKEKVRMELRRFLRKRSGRRPLVLPVIMET